MFIDLLFSTFRLSLHLLGTCLFLLILSFLLCFLGAKHHFSRCPNFCFLGFFCFCCFKEQAVRYIKNSDIYAFIRDKSIKIKSTTQYFVNLFRKYTSFY